MNEQEKGMIEGLFQRLRQAESQMGKRDAEAEALINGFMTRQSAAPYLLSQVVLVQEQGLKNLQAQVEDLERQLVERPQGGGGFLGGLFGGGSQPAAPAQARPDGAQGLTRGGMGAAQQPGAQGGSLAQSYEYLARKLLDEWDLWFIVSLPGGGLLQRGRRGQDHLWGHRRKRARGRGRHRPVACLNG
jgi:hypothetical protein